MLGDDSKSSTLVISIFLIGLSCGYYYWGKRSQAYSERRDISLLYGKIEIAIALFAITFPLTFEFLVFVQQFLPNSFLADLLLTGMAILPPTFCMGATIPLLTTSLPESDQDINRIHARLYGLNTLGAFVGCILGAAVAIPLFGITHSYWIFGTLNLGIACFFCSNKLAGNIRTQTYTATTIPTLNSKVLSLLALSSGIVTLSFELLWMRIWSLSMGSNILVFPMVVSLFIAGLGLGSLTLKQVSVEKLRNSLFLSLLFSGPIFFLVPYFHKWIFHYRYALSNEDFAFLNFVIFNYAILAVCILPMAFFLGRILPLTYSLLEKNTQDYGFKCGSLYALNTCGTFLGAVGLSYFMLFVVNIDTVYKINFLILLCACSLVFTYQKKIPQLLLMIALGISFCFFAHWNRGYHALGLFHQRSIETVKDKGLFYVWDINNEITQNLFLEDGPIATVSVMNYSHPSQGPIGSRSIFINAKSDSNSRMDYSTLSLSSIIPYLHAPQTDHLQTMVIGMGTGVSAGLLGKFNDVAKVDIIEISPTVIKACPYFDKDNFDLIHNPKISIHALDAFRFIAKVNSKYDIIISEPTNPWTPGVENLFTSEFYERIQSHLSPGGIFLQWFHLYSVDKEIFATVLKNYLKIFPGAGVYFLDNGTDMGIINIADSKIFSKVSESRFNEPIVKDSLEKGGTPLMEGLEMLRISSKQLNYIAQTQTSYLHTLNTPTLGLRAAKAFVKNQNIDFNALIPLDRKRLVMGETPAFKQNILSKIASYFDQHPDYCSAEKQETLSGNHPFCSFAFNIAAAYKVYNEASSHDLNIGEAYAILRDAGFLNPETNNLSRRLEKLFLQYKSERDPENLRAIIKLIGELTFDKKFPEALSFSNSLRAQGFLDQHAADLLIHRIQELQNAN